MSRDWHGDGCRLCPGFVPSNGKRGKRLVYVRGVQGGKTELSRRTESWSSCIQRHVWRFDTRHQDSFHRMKSEPPNPSLERTSTGKALGPRADRRHHPSRGPSASPAAAAQLKRWAPPVQILASSSRASSGHLSALGGHRSARSTRPLPHGFGLHGCSMPTRLCSPRPAPLAPLLRGLDACCSLSTGQRSRRPLPNPALKRTASGGRLAPR